jgi:G6PDH family F420-dependent oxidoreductase
MAKIGYKLMTEEHGPSALVENAVAAEAAGFEFVAISDHFHPWVRAQGHAPFAWSVLGAVAHVTRTIGIATGLTCPIIRYHPAIIAQAAATIAVMSEGRFTLAVGAGERLNEHVTGAPWPSIAERHAMLGEAVDIFRELWEGGARAYEGEFFVLDHAELFDLPPKPIAVIVGVSGEKSVALAAEKADGIMATAPDRSLVESFREHHQTGEAWGEVSLAYADREADGRRLARERFAFSALGWSVNSELPSVEGFEAATKFIREDDLAEAIPAGPDPEVHLEAIRKFIDAGFDHIALLGIGPDQAGFIRFAEKELLPKLR